MARIRGKRWSNWAGNQTATPVAVERPASEHDVVSIVQRARDEGRTVKAVGTGHSFTSTAVTTGHLVTMSRLSGVRAVDHDAGTVTVGAGTTIDDLNHALHDLGLAMPNLGDIAYQTISGAIATSTHGTGARLTGLAGQVRGVRLVTGTGEVVALGPSDGSAFDAARVNLGALGIVTEYTLGVVPAFRLRAVEGAQKLDDLLNGLDEHVERNDHFEFFWIPHTKWALTKRNNRTADALDPLPRVKGWIDKTFMENYAFGALCHLGRMRPSLIPRLATALPSSGARQYVDHSHKIFASPRLVRFYEMEHSIPAECVVPALRDVVAMVERKGYLLNFPVEVRFTAADEIALSTSFGRASAYIAVHVFKGMAYEPFFRDVEDIMRNYDSRPHWGKVHHRERDELSTLYPRFGEFLKLRDRLDPGRLFANDYTRVVFGE